MLQKESINTKVLDLLYSLQGKEYLKDFFLVGGTGLALMLGHRKSVDIDLFTAGDFDAENLLEKLESDFDFSMDYIDKNTIKGDTNGLKVDFLAHKYPLINKILEIEKLRIASIDDISAMKVNSIANDGTRVKDFIDLFFLISEHGYTVEKLIKNYETKYVLRNAMHALKSLNYFEEVNIADWPELLKNKELSWKDVRNRIDKACKDYIRMITRNGQD
jgi:hypothetical protein